MDHHLYNIWKTLCYKTTNKQNHVDEIFKIIVARHTEPHRAYHNLEHLSALITLIDMHWKGDSSTLLYATFFHDIVYNPGNSNNEALSAEIAAQKMEQLKVPLHQRFCVHEIIMLTANHTNTPKNLSSEALFFLDIDLSILGSELAEYKSYCNKIRQEFKAFPDGVYARARMQFLAKMLSERQIFKTAPFIASSEKKANENMSWELIDIRARRVMQLDI